MWKAVRQEDFENTSLKDLYAAHVNGRSEKILKAISAEIMGFCIGKIIDGCELPYSIVTPSRGIDSVDDLEPYLSEFGIVAESYLATEIGLIEVNVTHFTK